MSETKPKAKWRLTFMHPFIILMMILGALILFDFDIEMIQDYLKATLPVYLLITIIMYIPKIPLFLRLMLSLVAIFGYAFFMATITPDDIKHVNKAIVFMTSIAPFLGYMIFIWAGYIRKPAKEEEIIKKDQTHQSINPHLTAMTPLLNKELITFQKLDTATKKSIHHHSDLFCINKKSLLIIFLSILASALQLPVAMGIAMVVELFLMLFTWQL